MEATAIHRTLGEVAKTYSASLTEQDRVLARASEVPDGTPPLYFSREGEALAVLTHFLGYLSAVEDNATRRFVLESLVRAAAMFKRDEFKHPHPGRIVLEEPVWGARRIPMAVTINLIVDFINRVAEVSGVPEAATSVEDIERTYEALNTDAGST